MAAASDIEALGPGRVRLYDTTVVITAEEWREHVVRREVAVRNDSGIDAMRAGQGPAYAEAELEELVASRGADFVVWFRGDLHSSSREELPPI